MAYLLAWDDKFCVPGGHLLLFSDGIQTLISEYACGDLTAGMIFV
ncbi:hypothetical protein ACFFN8_001796 [Raoultella planticola]|nr:hypothetical protein [Raoultella planticola]